MKITLRGMFGHSGGYSELTRNLAVVLDDLGVLVGLDPWDKDLFQAIPKFWFQSAEYGAVEVNTVAKLASVYKDVPDTIFQFTPPFMFKPTPEGIKRNVGFTMFETRVPEEWFKQVGFLDDLVLHDAFQVGLFKRECEHLWTPWVLNPMDAKPIQDFCPDPYILTVGVARVHKNQSKIISAFQAIKKHFPGLKLVIKAIIEDPEYDDYRARVSDDSDIYVLPGNYSAVALDSLYRNCAAYVSASMCEGLDMPAIKAAMCGKPLVCGKHTGHLSWVPDAHPAVATVEVDMAAIKNIHPRYREPSMLGYDCPVEDLECHMAAALNPASADSYKIDMTGKFTREASKESIDKLLKELV